MREPFKFYKVTYGPDQHFLGAQIYSSEISDENNYYSMIYIQSDFTFRVFRFYRLSGRTHTDIIINKVFPSLFQAVHELQIFEETATALQTIYNDCLETVAKYKEHNSVTDPLCRINKVTEI